MSITVSTLQGIREAKRLTRRAVAAQLDMSERHLARLEDGSSPLKRVHLLALAGIYEVPVEVLEEKVA